MLQRCIFFLGLRVACARQTFCLPPAVPKPPEAPPDPSVHREPHERSGVSARQQSQFRANGTTPRCALPRREPSHPRRDSLDTVYSWHTESRIARTIWVGENPVRVLHASPTQRLAPLGGIIGMFTAPLPAAPTRKLIKTHPANEGVFRGHQRSYATPPSSVLCSRRADGAALAITRPA